MDENLRNLSRAAAAIGRIDAVPTIFAVLRDTTGMRFAAIARVTASRWTACAVEDGLHPGVEASTEANLAFESTASRMPFVVGHASTDPRFRVAAGSPVHPVESYISVPIFLTDGDYFGALCAFDPAPMNLPAPMVLSVMSRLAALIASQLEHQLAKEHEHRALLDEREAGELREQFIAILGHDLRTPLQAVFASSDLLQRKLVDPVLRAYAGRITTNVRRMSALIDDVLDFARGRLGGGIAVELTEVQNIDTGLTTVIQELQDAQPGCRILSSIRVDRAVRCDLGRLQQVASNLLANALTHGRVDTPVKITVSADESHLILQVWNAGEPIPAESLDKIFEPFWRHSVSSSRNGLGLGLHICSQIVRAHEGKISVTSTAAQGTLFTARLPLGSATNEAHPAARPTPGAEARRSPLSDPAVRAHPAGRDIELCR